MKKLTTIFYLAISTILSVSCSNGSPANVNNHVVAQSNNNQQTADSAAINLSNVTTIPTLANQATNFSVLLINNSNHQLSNSQFTVSNSSQEDSGIIIDGSNCHSVKPQESCKLHIHLPKDYQEGFFLLKASADVNDKLLSTEQLISYAKLNKNIHNIHVGQLSSEIMTTSGQKFSVAIPVHSENTNLISTKLNLSDLDQDSNNFSSELECSSETDCTLLVEGTLIANRGLDISLMNTAGTPLLNVPAKTSYAKSGHLIMAASTQIQNPADGNTSTTVTLINNGVANVSNINFTYDKGDSVVINPLSCSAPLLPNTSCTFTIKIKSNTSGNGKLLVNYNDGITSQSANLNLAFVTANRTAGFYLSSSDIGMMTDNLVGESRTATITFTNSGTADLSNIQIGSTEKQNSAVITSKGTCAGTIIAGNTCNFTVSYTPQKAEAGNMILQVSAEYADQSRAGQLSLISNVLYFNYNANSRQVFLTANGSQDGFNRCDLAADGKSLINCVVAGAGASSSNKLGGLLYKFGISFFRSANESITAYVSRGDDSAARDGLAICNMTNAGDFNGCTVPDTGAIMVQNRVANIFGSNYLFTTNANYTDSISTKAKLRESDGSITVASSGGTWENVDATPTNQATNNQGVAVYKQYVYISQFYINNVVTNVLKCTVMPNGSWKSGYSACTRSDSGTQDDVYSSEVVTLNKQAYLYMATNLSARRMIVRCKLQESDGNFNSSDCKMALNNQAGAYPGTTEKYTTIAGSPRTLTYMKINGNNYLLV